jgi:hypothetical protein
MPILVAMQSQAWVYSSVIAVMAGLNFAEGMDVRLLGLLCIVQVVVSVMS